LHTAHANTNLFFNLKFLISMFCFPYLVKVVVAAHL